MPSPGGSLNSRGRGHPPITTWAAGTTAPGSRRRPRHRLGDRGQEAEERGSTGRGSLPPPAAQPGPQASSRRPPPSPGPRLHPAAQPGSQAPSCRDVRPRGRHRISDERVPGTKRFCSLPSGRTAGAGLTSWVPRDLPAPRSLPWRRPRHPRPPTHRVPSPRRRPGLRAPASLGVPGTGRPHDAHGAAAAGPGASRVPSRP